MKQSYYVWQCYDSESPLSYTSAIMMYVYLALLQVVGLILAIKTRNVKIKTLNDAKYVAILIYISSIVLPVMLMLNFAFSVAYLNLSALLYNGGIHFVITAFLLLLFVPKVSVVYSARDDGSFSPTHTREQSRVAICISPVATVAASM